MFDSVLWYIHLRGSDCHRIGLIGTFTASSLVDINPNTSLSKVWLTPPHYHDWLVVWNMFFFSHILGISSSQLTLSPSFFRGVGGSTTNQILPSRRYGWIHRDGDWTGQTLPILGGAVPVVVTYIYGGCIISQQNWALFHDDDDDWEPYSFSKPS